MWPPSETTQFEELPSDEASRHEAAIEILGHHIFAMRNQAMKTVRQNVERSQDGSTQMASLHRAEYDAVASLPTTAREAALNLAHKSVDLFMQHLLTLFTYNGISTDIDAGPDHAIAYEILLKFIRQDTLEPVETHVVDNGGEKVFGDYYGRWLNRYKDA